MDTHFSRLFTDDETSKKEDIIQIDQSIDNTQTERETFKQVSFEVKQDLITNIEEYAEQIQKNAEQYARKIKARADQVKQESEELESLIKQQKKEAKMAAKAIIAQANKEKDLIFQKTKQEAEDLVREEVKSELTAEYKGYLDTFVKLTQEMNKLYKEISFTYKEDLVEIALVICEKILDRELKVTKEADIANMLQKSLKYFSDSKRIVIRINTSLYDFVTGIVPSLQGYMNEEQKLIIQHSEEIPLYAPIIESESLRLNLAIENKFAWFRSQLESYFSRHKTKVDTPNPQT